jgi:hypothetical protein
VPGFRLAAAGKLTEYWWTAIRQGRRSHSRKGGQTGSQAEGVRGEACVIEWSELLIGLAILFGTAMLIISAKRAIARVPKAAWVATDARETLVTLALLVFLILGATLVIRFLLFELS